MTKQSFSNLFDPLGIGQASTAVWQAMLSDPEHLLRSQQQLACGWLNMLNGESGTEAQPASSKATVDKRFSHPAWDANPGLRALKDAYLIATDAVLSSIENTPGADPKAIRRAKFFAKQFADAMSPSNFAFFNPLVIEETLRTGGQNLAKGMQNLIEDIRENAGRPALVDKKAFRVGKNVAVTPGRVVHRNQLCELLQYEATTPTVHEKPVLIVPPWINKYYVLDLQPDNSLIKALVDQGFTTFVISWRNPDAELRDMTMRDYLVHGPLECIQVATEITKTDSCSAVGYCIGGTLLAMLLAYLAKRREPIVGAATFLASLIDFLEAGEIEAFLGEDALAYIEKKMGERGYLDAREMSDSFNMLRSNDLIWSVAVNRYLLGKDAPAFDLLYWNSDSTRMPAAMHAYYLRNMYVENNLVKHDVLEIDGTPLDLHDIKNDVYCVATIEDHIAPWKSVYKLTQLTSGQTAFRLGASGHIAGIINAPKRLKGAYWSGTKCPPDPDAWLAAASKHEGSWWPDWFTWLSERSGPRVPVSQIGSIEHPPQEAAPGTYVLAT
ncbi:MAG: class I poly(R)-hydroxyalkanoic acid synthase [Candidatus Eremiobacteraeota bacterium]|nr:class I poly(R)-hydroxyalkanoic acid synthase [Candidatus Eremiobacteraeota bacterium]